MITFIIPAYNEERLLGRTLHALRDAARVLTEEYEIVVVDDASTDGTAAIAHACSARVVQVNKRQIAATRNAGAREAKGGMFFFIDADTMVTKGGMAKILDFGLAISQMPSFSTIVGLGEQRIGDDSPALLQTTGFS